MSGALSHSPAKVVAELLIDLGHATAASNGLSWPVYVSVLPDSPDASMAVVDTQGVKDGRSMIGGTVYLHHGFQILLRGQGYNAAWLKLHKIALSLDGVNRTNVPIGSTTYQIQSITRVGSIISVGFDETSKRRLFSLNGLISLRQLAGTGSY